MKPLQPPPNTIYELAHRVAKTGGLRPQLATWTRIYTALYAAMQDGYLFVPAVPINARSIPRDTWEAFTKEHDHPCVVATPTGKRALLSLRLHDGFTLPPVAVLGAKELARGACAFKKERGFGELPYLHVIVTAEDAEPFAAQWLDYALEHVVSVN